MDYWERGSPAQGVYPTQYTSRMETVRVKQEEETDARIMKNSKKCGRKERGHEWEKSQTRSKDLNIEHPEGRESTLL